MDTVPFVSAAPGLYLTSNGSLNISTARQRNSKRALDNRLSYNDSNQSYIDCSTIPGWMKFVKSIAAAAWNTGNDATDPIFTHDYGILPEDPKALKGVIIVWEILSKIPGETSRSGIRNIKPVVREEKNTDDGSEIIWAQLFDIVMMFTIYGDSWDRMYEYLEKFEELMLTYTGTFIGTGLTQLTFREQTRDALYDPPKAEAFPNKTIMYNARIETQTRVKTQLIEQILIQVGVMSPVGVQDEIQAIESGGLPSSEILIGNISP